MPIITVSGPSGGGKTTLADMATEEDPCLIMSVSDTSRKPTEHEKEGVHYNFISSEEFERRIAAGYYAEWALVHGNYYGTPKQALIAILDAKSDALLDVDCQGAAQIRKWRPDATSIFIAPPTYKDLEHRLRTRKRDTEETIQRRLRNAREEFKRVDEFDYYIVNSTRKEALEDFMVLLRAARGGNVASLTRYCNPIQRQQWMRMVM